MTWPTSAVSTANLDATGDNPRLAQADLLDAVTKLNQMRAHVTTYAQGLLDDANAAAARATLGAAPASRVMGLTGNVNGSVPTTSFDLAALRVTLEDSSGATVTVKNTGTKTCNLGLTGSAANGRDQAGAFSASSWIHLYFIWNGTTLATLASTTAPASFTGSTLPSGYTHWAYATAIRWNSSSNIIKSIVRGAQVFYDVDVATNTRLLSAGVVTVSTYAALGCGNVVPPNALTIRLGAILSVQHSANQTFAANLRAGGSTSPGFSIASVAAAANVPSRVDSHVDLAMSAAQTLEYGINVAPNLSGGLYLDCLGYRIPNGDA